MPRTDTPPHGTTPQPDTASLLELTALPTGPGMERRVIDRIRDWARARPGIARREDPHGNLELSLEHAPPSERPVCFTAHLDHPAFCVIRACAPTVLEAEFRGGVMADYFPGAAVEWIPADPGDAPIRGTVAGEGDQTDPRRSWIIELDTEADAAPGDLIRWALPDAEIATETLMTGATGPMLRTDACDDLAALASALEALDRLRTRSRAGEAIPDTRVLLTRGEEIGFLGAIAAAQSGFIPRAARLLALETSRSYPDSPIGGGPIARVGDRLSTFSPGLTAAVCRVARTLTGADAEPRSTEKQPSDARPWQRKLMPGGACEASVYCAYGFDATCVCLPLGNYHNMADLTAVQAGTNTEPPRLEREYIAIDDYATMTDLLEACATELEDAPDLRPKFERLWHESGGVLGQPPEPTSDATHNPPGRSPSPGTERSG